MGRAKEIVDQYWQAMETGNVEAVRELLAGDGVVTLPGGFKWRGRTS